MSSSSGKDLLDLILNEILGNSYPLVATSTGDESNSLISKWMAPYLKPDRTYDFENNKFVTEVIKFSSKIINDFLVSNASKNEFKKYENTYKYPYTSFDNSFWFNEPNPKFSGVRHSNLYNKLASMGDAKNLFKNYSKEVPSNIGDMIKFTEHEDFIDKTGLVYKFLKLCEDYLQEAQKMIDEIDSFLSVSMYNSQAVYYNPINRAFFTSYVPEDLGFQYQEIRISNGRLFTRYLYDSLWSEWTLASPDVTGTKSMEITVGDVGALPLGSSENYRFNSYVEPIKAGEVVYCLTRDIMLSGLPESLRYGSKGYRLTPDTLLEDMIKGVHPNSMGCYGLFDPQNDINEPDSNGLMEIMPSTEMFSEEIPRPVFEQQRGWLETKYDGLYYFQNWTPMSPTNSNWCDEKDCPRYTYHRKGTLQIADRIQGKLPFIKWERWRQKNNIETSVDWGLITTRDIERKLNFRGLKDDLSILILSELYEQPVDTTYTWTIKDEQIDEGTTNKRLKGLPSIQDESGPPLKTVEDKINGGIFKLSNPAPLKRRSIFSRLTCHKTSDIIYYEWRDLGQVYQTEVVNGRQVPKDVGILSPLGNMTLEKNMNQSHMFPDKDHDMLSPGSSMLPNHGSGLFVLKEKSSDFCYYKEGRLSKTLDLSSLPEKKYTEITLWDAWHSIDERLKSIESRLNFMEALQNLPPGANYVFMPPLSTQYLTKESTEISFQYNNTAIENLLKSFGSDRNANSYVMVSGEYTPAYMLKLGYNVNMDLFDTKKSFWGDFLHYSIVGEGVGNNNLLWTPYADITGNPFKLGFMAGIKNNTVYQFNKTRGVSPSARNPFPLPLGPDYQATSGGMRCNNEDYLRDGGKWTRHYFRAVSRQVSRFDDWMTGWKIANAAGLTALIALGIAGAIFGPVAVAASIVALVLIIGTQIGVQIQMGIAKSTVVDANLTGMGKWAWLPTRIPVSNVLKAVTRRTDIDIDFAGKIDTGLWGWILELKRRTDSIKFLYGMINSIYMSLNAAIMGINVITYLTVSLILPVPPASGALPIPFFTMSMGGMSATGFAAQSNFVFFCPCPPYHSGGIARSPQYGALKCSFDESQGEWYEWFAALDTEVTYSMS